MVLLNAKMTHLKTLSKALLKTQLAYIDCRLRRVQLGKLVAQKCFLVSGGLTPKDNDIVEKRGGSRGGRRGLIYLQLFLEVDASEWRPYSFVDFIQDLGVISGFTGNLSASRHLRPQHNILHRNTSKCDVSDQNPCRWELAKTPHSSARISGALDRRSTECVRTTRRCKCSQGWSKSTKRLASNEGYNLFTVTAASIHKRILKL